MNRSIKVMLVLLLALLATITLVSCKSEDKIYYEDNNNEKEILYSSYINKKNPVVTVIIKDMGEIEMQLFPKVAKNTVNNFITYIQNESFTNSDFHRIIKGFMIQGGMVKDINLPIKGEFKSNGVTNNLKHERGVLSMARTSDKNSATSQFFIVHKSSPHLNGEYASFGGLISGFDVLDEIANVNTYYDSPISKVVIESMTIKLNGYKVK